MHCHLPRNVTNRGPQGDSPESIDILIPPVLTRAAVRPCSHVRYSYLKVSKDDDKDDYLSSALTASAKPQHGSPRVSTRRSCCCDKIPFNRKSRNKQQGITPPMNRSAVVSDRAGYQTFEKEISLGDEADYTGGIGSDDT